VRRGFERGGGHRRGDGRLNAAANNIVIARSQRVRPFGRPDDRLCAEAIQKAAAGI
jgi:hypothetical protein